MNPPRILTAFALLFLGASLPLGAQQVYDLRFVPVLTDGTLEVTIQLRVSPDAQVGSGNLVFNFNDEALGVPSGTLAGRLSADTDFTFLNYSGGAYQPGNVTLTAREGQDVLSVNLELNSSDTGTLATSDFTDVVRLTFDVADPEATTNFVWQPGDTFLLNGADESTYLVQGTFEGSDAQLPVELSAFEAVTEGDVVVLRWTTLSEQSNAGFGIEHTSATGSFVEAAFVPGQGTKAEPTAYVYRVMGLAPRTYRFRLRQVDTDGAFQYSPEVEVLLEAPRVLSLMQNTPNPFRGATEVSFTVPASGEVSLVLYDVLGREVARLFDGPAEAGRLHRARFEAGTLGAGTYVYRLSRGSQVLTKTMTLLR